MNDNSYDLVITGGGMVGATLAAALRHCNLKIAIIEQFPLKSDQQPSYDARSIALAWGSKVIFDALGLWQALEPLATPIKTIHVSDRGHFGTTTLSHSQERVPALGYVVENRAFGNAFEPVLQHNNIELICPASLTAIEQHAEHCTLTIEQDQQQRTINTRLLVAADGGQSTVCKLLDIQKRSWPYNQTAVICTVTPEKKHQHIAYERFTDSGPLALLPMSDNRYSVVFTLNSNQVDELLALDDAAFLQRLQQRFGYRLGRFIRTSARHAYPLNLHIAETDIAARTVIIGNAAHTLHPVAGQGFNLGLRDVAVLAELIAAASQQGEDPGSDALLQHYHQLRKRDQQSTALLTDGLVRLFSNPLPPLKTMRSKILGMTSLLPGIKHQLARKTMGLQPPLTRLGRGLKL